LVPTIERHTTCAPFLEFPATQATNERTNQPIGVPPPLILISLVQAMNGHRIRVPLCWSILFWLSIFQSSRAFQTVTRTRGRNLPIPNTLSVARAKSSGVSTPHSCLQSMSPSHHSQHASTAIRIRKHLTKSVWQRKRSQTSGPPASRTHKFGWALGVGTIMGILWSSFASGAHAASSMTAAKPTILGSNAVNNFAGAFPTLRVVSTALLLVSSFGGVLLQLALRQLQYGAAWYMTQLALYPVLTKSATAALIGYIGDYMAQWLEYKLEQNHQKGVIGGGSCDGTQHHHKISLNSSNSRVSARSNLSIHGTYDLRRGLSIMTDGLHLRTAHALWIRIL
jgi:hypothetical protein